MDEPLNFCKDGVQIRLNNSVWEERGRRKEGRQGGRGREGGEEEREEREGGRGGGGEEGQKREGKKQRRQAGGKAEVSKQVLTKLQSVCMERTFQ